MEDEDHIQIDLEIETVLARLNSYNLEEINITKLFKKQIEPLKGLWIQLNSFTARNSLHLVVREKIDSLDQWLNQRIAVIELENLDEHLDRFIENKDARFREQQIFVAQRFEETILRLKGRLRDFNEVGHPMVRYIKYWLRRTETAEIIKKSSSSMHGKDHNQIDDLEIETLISQLDHYNTYLDTDLNLEGYIIATMFEGEIRLLDSHEEVLGTSRRDYIEKDISKTSDNVKQWVKKKTIDSGDTEEIRDERKREGMSSSQSLITRKNISVLVVDNDSDYLIVHCLQLILFGKLTNFEMKVKAVTHGNEALDLIRKGASFDLIIMDMDKSTNGVEATKELRALGVKSSIIGLISSTSETQQQAFMEAGLEGCFGKTLKADQKEHLVSTSQGNQPHTEKLEGEEGFFLAAFAEAASVGLHPSCILPILPILSISSRYVWGGIM